jgi:hypothetical protein
MTHTEWVAATAPAPMTQYLAHHTREVDSLLRRSRLAAIACCRDIPATVMPADGPALLDAIESWLDAGGRRPVAIGRLEKGLTAEVERLLPGWRACLHAGKYSARPYRLYKAAVAVTLTALPYRSQIDRAMILNGTVSAADAHPRRADARRRAADRVRCVFGNPFRPVRVSPGWHTPDVLARARAIYDERAFGDLPILADALEDAGCGDPDILSHCRSDGPHARGCWAVDALLGNR